MKKLNLYKRLKANKTLVNGTMFSMFSFLSRGISFVLLIILARYIMPADYGRLSIFSTIIQLLSYVIVLSCQGFFAVSFFKRKGELFRQDFTSIILIQMCCTVIISIALLFSSDTLASFSELPPPYLWFALVICVFQEFMFFYNDYQRIQEKVIKYGLVSCGYAIINFALSIYLVVYKGMNWNGRVYSYLICTVVFGLFGIMMLVKNKLFTRHVTWKGTKKILFWGIPLIPHQAAAWIKQGCDSFIINETHSINEVGIFNFALTLTSVIIMIGTAFNSTNSVSIYQILSSDLTANEKKIQLKKQTRNIGLIYTIGYLLVLLFGSSIIPLLLPDYLPSLPFFWITSVSGFFYCLYFLFVNYLFYYGKNQKIMMITFLTAVFHLGLSLLLTRYSLYWTAIIYVISQGVVLLLIVWQAIRVLREKLID